MIGHFSEHPNADEIRFDHDLRNLHHSRILAICSATLALGVE
jgi:hypothetical protein